MCSCILLWKPDRMMSVFPLLLSSIVLRQSLSLNSNLAILSMLDIQQVLRIFLSATSPVPQCWDCGHMQLCLAFYMGAGNLSSGPHANVVGKLVGFLSKV